MTSRGWGVLAASLVVLGAGVATGYRALLAVAVVGGAVTLGSVLAVRLRPTLTVTRALRSHRVERGARTAGSARVVNIGRVRTSSLVASDRIAGRSEPFTVPSLRAGADTTEHYYIPTDRRGRLTLGPMILTNGDPFGLARRSVEVGDLAELVVTPRVLFQPDVRRSLLRSVDGVENQSNIEGSLAFHTLREYAPGDDLRHVHWKSSARGAGLLVKQYIDNARPCVAIICDTALPAGTGGDDDAAIEAFDVIVDCAASVAASALSRLQPVWLHSGDSSPRWYRPMGSGADASALLIDDLTALQARDGDPTDRTRLLANAMQSAGTAGPGSLAVLLTTAAIEALPASLNALAQSYAVALVVHHADTSSLRQQGRVWYLGVTRVDDLADRLRDTGAFV